MGRCHFCNDSNAHHYCETCDATWCSECDEDCETFFYGGEMRCTVCFPTEPKPIQDADLLEYALRKLDTTKEELVADLSRLREFSKPQNKYACTDQSDHSCAPKCTTLGEDHDGVRGLCCRAKSKSHDTWCDQCRLFRILKRARQ